MHENKHKCTTAFTTVYSNAFFIIILIFLESFLNIYPTTYEVDKNKKKKR